jgi:hypothetical protein
MPREINDKKETNWTLVPACGGLKETGEEMSDAARLEGKEDSVYVVATPSGGAQTVRLPLRSDLEESLSDEELFAEIKANQK